MRIGSKLKRHREKMRLSQDDLASVLNTTQKTISNWESNKGLPTLAQFASIGDVLQVDVLQWFEECGIIFKKITNNDDNEKLVTQHFNDIIQQYKKCITEKNEIIIEQKKIIELLLQKVNNTT